MSHEPKPQANPLLQRYSEILGIITPAAIRADYMRNRGDLGLMQEWLQTGAESIKRAMIQIDAPDDDPIREVLNKSPILYIRRQTTPSVAITVTKSESDSYYFIAIQCGPYSSIHGHISPKDSQYTDVHVYSCNFFDNVNAEDRADIGTVRNLSTGFMFNPSYAYESPIVPISLPNGWQKYFDPKTNQFFTEANMEHQLQVLQSHMVDFDSLTSDQGINESLFSFLLRKKQEWIEVSKTSHVYINAQGEQEWTGQLKDTKFNMKFRHPVNHPERLYVSIGPIQLPSSQFYERTLSEDHKTSLGGEFNLANLMLGAIGKPMGYLTIILNQNTPGEVRKMIRRGEEDFADPSLHFPTITDNHVSKLVTNFNPVILEAPPVKKERTVKPPPTRKQLREKERHDWEERMKKQRHW